MATIRFFILLIALNCVFGAALAIAPDSSSEVDLALMSQGNSSHPEVTPEELKEPALIAWMILSGCIYLNTAFRVFCYTWRLALADRAVDGVLRQDFSRRVQQLRVSAASALQITLASVFNYIVGVRWLHLLPGFLVHVPGGEVIWCVSVSLLPLSLGLGILKTGLVNFPDTTHVGRILRWRIVYLYLAGAFFVAVVAAAYTWVHFWGLPPIPSYQLSLPEAFLLSSVMCYLLSFRETMFENI